MEAKSFTVLLLLFFTQGISMVTIRDIIEDKLAAGPSLPTWELDLALSSFMSSTEEFRISDDQAETLYNILRFVPRSPPSPIFSILENRGVLDVDALLDFDVESFISGLNLQCDKNKSCTPPEVVSMLTKEATMNTSNEVFEECQKDLQPLVTPLVNFTLNYVKSALKRTRTDCKGWSCLACRTTLSVVEGVIQGIIAGMGEEQEIPKWGWTLLDAMAKPPTGIMGGQLQWVGSYEMCNKIDTSYEISVNETHNITRPIRGKYCRIMIGMVNSSSLLLRLGFGACLPDTCSTDSVRDYLEGNPGYIGDVLGLAGLEIKMIFCGHDLDYPTDTRAQTAIAIMAILIVIALCASIYDGLIRKKWLKNWINKDEMFAPQVTRMSNGVIQNAASVVPKQDQVGIRRQSSLASTTELLSALSIEGDHVLHKKPSFLMRLEAAFASFSVLTSFRSVCDVSHLGEHYLPTADAVRFLSLAYAIGGNTFLFGIIHTESITTSNLVAKMLELPHVFLFQPIVNFAFTADSLLVVSGVMVSFHWLRRLFQVVKNLRPVRRTFGLIWFELGETQLSVHGLFFVFRRKKNHCLKISPRETL